MTKNQLDYIAEIASASSIGYANMLADKLAKLILEGKLEANSMLPNENEMCKLLSVGRSTIREAYKVLDTMGYITRTKTGTNINDVHSLAIKGSFQTSLKLTDLEELVEFILLLEPKAAYYAALRATDEELVEIKKYLDECANYNGDIKVLEKANRLFHEKIRHASHNKVLVSAIAASFGAFEEFIVKPVYKEDKESIDFLNQCIVEHQELFDAILEKDASRAQEISELHLRADVRFSS
ncbi:FadR family transcriptional regulator [Erysipelothrix sp. HDW6A]|uniref:FadR/GntR family transcriptional regulator n=1 Tax=Erysipelothrix sp. HDW6A TaxID=2714928 RepID=UPI001407C513|nr:FCD domain-containing protein [Erysipelothrix sp. HDW6A]QIK57247.1 FadR family transcriptional regulator [Erysipelothrix sp. HDW6A]